MLAPPPFRFRLTRPVGPDQPNRPEDVTAIQEALDGFAQYHIKNAKSGRHDEGLASSLRDVQRRFGLKPDGVAKPGGPTEFLLNAILAGGVTALAPDPVKAPDRGTFRQRLLIKRPVGEGAGNDPDDEAVVRHGLTLLGDLPFGAVIPGNRLETKALGDAIERFHRRRGLSQGRQVKPGSPAAVTFAKELGIAYADRLPEEAPARRSDRDRDGAEDTGNGGASLLRTADRRPGQAGDPDVAKPSVQTADAKSPDWLQNEATVLGTDLPSDRVAKIADTVKAMNGDGDALPPVQDRLDVLRYHYEEQRLGVRSELSADVVSAILRIYGSFGIDEAFAAIQQPLQQRAFAALVSDQGLVANLNAWQKLNQDQRKAVLRRAAAIFSDAYGLAKVPHVDFGELPGQDTYALFQTANSLDGFGYITIDPARLDAGYGLTVLNDLIHELGHAYQQTLLLELFGGKMSTDDPRRLQVELFALSRPYYFDVIKPLRADSKYFTDPNERHAQRLKEDWNAFAQSRSLTGP